MKHTTFYIFFSFLFLIGCSQNIANLQPIEIENLANNGDSNAQYTMGNIYKNGEGRTKDFFKALKWYEKAAKSGHIEAQYNLAMMYGKGEGTLKNPKQTFFGYKNQSNIIILYLYSLLEKCIKKDMELNKVIQKLLNIFLKLQIMEMLRQKII